MWLGSAMVMSVLVAWMCTGWVEPGALSDLGSAATLAASCELCTVGCTRRWDDREVSVVHRLPCGAVGQVLTKLEDSFAQVRVEHTAGEGVWLAPVEVVAVEVTGRGGDQGRA